VWLERRKAWQAGDEQQAKAGPQARARSQGTAMARMIRHVPSPVAPLIDPLFFATVRLSTFNGTVGLTNASGFFFRRDGELFLVSSRHVFIDEEQGHLPDRLEIELHLDAQNAARSIGWSVLLYEDKLASWHQGRDSGGEIDVAAIRIQEDKLPAGTALQAFTPEHLACDDDEVDIGQALVIPGFPLGFHDAMHHLPVARHAAVASPWGLRFQGNGYFLTDARTHSGTSGAPVVMRMASGSAPQEPLRWKLLGVHSSRLDMGNRDRNVDESLGLNVAWYADILMTLTGPRDTPTP
jgi:hypothetical protein